MTVLEVVDKLKELGGKLPLSSSDKSDIEVMYHEVLLQAGFGSGEMYTNDNLTDEAAERFLAGNSKGIVFFALTPSDWEERVEKRKNPVTALDETLVSELVKAFQVEGATVKIVKEAFKTYQVDGKKVTVKLLDAHIKKAQSLLEPEQEVADNGVAREMVE